MLRLPEPLGTAVRPRVKWFQTANRSSGFVCMSNLGIPIGKEGVPGGVEAWALKLRKFRKNEAKLFVEGPDRAQTKGSIGMSALLVKVTPALPRP